MKRKSLAEELWKLIVRIHIAVYRRLGGVGKHTILLTTTGRKSGQSRTRALYAVKDGDDYVVIASYGGAPQHPDWYLNLLANPHATVEDHGHTISAIARTVEDEEERQQLWAKMTAIYAPYDDYQKRTNRKIPVVLLSPQMS